MFNEYFDLLIRRLNYCQFYTQLIKDNQFQQNQTQEISKTSTQYQFDLYKPFYTKEFKFYNEQQIELREIINEEFLYFANINGNYVIKQTVLSAVQKIGNLALQKFTEIKNEFDNTLTNQTQKQDSIKQSLQNNLIKQQNVIVKHMLLAIDGCYDKQLIEQIVQKILENNLLKYLSFLKSEQVESILIDNIYQNQQSYNPLKLLTFLFDYYKNRGDFYQAYQVGFDKISQFQEQENESFLQNLSFEFSQRITYALQSISLLENYIQTMKIKNDQNNKSNYEILVELEMDFKKCQQKIKELKFQNNLITRLFNIHQNYKFQNVQQQILLKQQINDLNKQPFKLVSLYRILQDYNLYDLEVIYFDLIYQQKKIFDETYIQDQNDLIIIQELYKNIVEFQDQLFKSSLETETDSAYKMILKLESNLLYKDQLFLSDFIIKEIVEQILLDKKTNLEYFLQNMNNQRQIYSMFESVDFLEQQSLHLQTLCMLGIYGSKCLNLEYQLNFLTQKQLSIGQELQNKYKMEAPFQIILKQLQDLTDILYSLQEFNNETQHQYD